MKEQLASLASRRLDLLNQIEGQRREMSAASQQMRRPLAIADAGLKVAHYIYGHPVLFAGGVTALLAWRRKGIIGLVKNGIRLLYLYPSVVLFGLKYLSSDARSASDE